MDAVNAWLSTIAASAQTTVGLIALFMLLAGFVGAVYYGVARALQGPFPALYAPVSGDWAKTTAILWVVLMAIMGALWGVLTAAISGGGYHGLGA